MRESFEKENAYILARELQQHWIDEHDKYDDIYVEDFSSNEVEIRCFIDWGHLTQDYQFFDAIVREFFGTKNILISIEEELANIVEERDLIYSSIHKIKKVN